MKREELEKTIENGESVWCSRRLEKIKLDRDYYIYDDLLENRVLGIAYFIKELFKTKTEAEHYLRHANITRTEHLPFLTWEEFSEGKEIKFNSKKSEYLMIYLAGNITIYQYYYDNGLKLQLRIFDEEATEANFYKAYDECVRLFRGEE